MLVIGLLVKNLQIRLQPIRYQLPVQRLTWSVRCSGNELCITSILVQLHTGLLSDSCGVLNDNLWAVNRTGVRSFDYPSIRPI